MTSISLRSTAQTDSPGETGNSYEHTSQSSRKGSQESHMVRIQKRTAMQTQPGGRGVRGTNRLTRTLTTPLTATPGHKTLTLRKTRMSGTERIRTTALSKETPKRTDQTHLVTRIIVACGAQLALRKEEHFTQANPNEVE